MSRIEMMIARAREALEQAHAPYSGFRVGACLLGAGGGLYAGCNVENASYPEGCCAEASAISAMVLDGERRIAEVVVMVENTEPCAPCGGCRQRLSEFAGADSPIHLLNDRGEQVTVTLGELLPRTFSSDQLPAFQTAAKGKTQTSS